MHKEGTTLAASLTSLRPRVQRHFRSFGLPDGLRLLPLELGKQVAGSAYRRWAHPYLYEFEKMSANACGAPDEILARCTGATQAAIAALRGEFELLGKTLDERYAARRLAYPTHYAVTNGSAFLLYALVRLRRPQSILETGVANGHSTYYLLHALRANAAGRLCSVDIGEDVGVLLDAHECAAWSYIRLKPGRERKDFERCVEGLRPLDMFLHDSDHTYQWQMFEYRCAWANLSRGGFFLSDNIDQSFAFMDFCAERKQEPALLFHLAKIFGVLEASR